MTIRDPLSWLTVLGIGGVLSAIVVGLFNRRKVSGDYVTAIAGAATSLVDPLREEIARLHKQIEDQDARHRRECAELRDELEETRAELAGTREECETSASRLTEELQDARAEVIALRAELAGSAGGVVGD